jgi:hypothetical protein
MFANIQGNCYEENVTFSFSRHTTRVVEIFKFDRSFTNAVYSDEMVDLKAYETVSRFMFCKNHDMLPF